MIGLITSTVCHTLPRRGKSKLVLFGLLADTEGTEDLPEQFFGIRLADDFADCIQRGADLDSRDLGRLGCAEG